MSEANYRVRTRDTDGGTNNTYKTLKGARKRFEEMYGHSMESAISEQYHAHDVKPTAEAVQSVSAVSDYGTVVLFERLCDLPNGLPAWAPGLPSTPEEKPEAPAVIQTADLKLNVEDIQIDVTSKSVVLEFNPENAEPGNPSGATYGERFFMQATWPDGRRMVHRHPFEVMENANAWALTAQRRLDSGGELDKSHWFEAPPVYGSDSHDETTLYDEEERQRYGC